MTPNSTPWPPRALRPTALALATLAAAIALAACQPVVNPAEASAPATAAEPPPVAVAKAQPSSAPAESLVARVEAAQKVELHARVAGPVEQVLFREGELVKAGQALFQIDPRPFDAAVARARADLKVARAREALAASEAERARLMQADRAIAAEEAERRAAAHAEAQARSAAAEAALQTAQLDREFSTVRAPISGRIGRALATPGNFVAAGNGGAALTSIVSVSPLHVHVDVAERLLPTGARGTGLPGWKARILDADGRQELALAPIDFSHHSIESATGTLRLRARIDQPKAGLMPGQYVRVELQGAAQAPALLVPDQALGTDQGRRYVLVVKPDGVVEYRPVEVGAAQNGQRLVRSGLQAGEQVVVSGLMRVRPGMKVKPQPATAAASAAATSS
jgi:multidrug efflux system membrane fusion protein